MKQDVVYNIVAIRIIYHCTAIMQLRECRLYNGEASMLEKPSR